MPERHSPVSRCHRWKRRPKGALAPPAARQVRDNGKHRKSSEMSMTLAFHRYFPPVMIAGMANGPVSGPAAGHVTESSRVVFKPASGPATRETPVRGGVP